jgi:hypothetical protein
MTCKRLNAEWLLEEDERLRLDLVAPRPHHGMPMRLRLTALLLATFALPIFLVAQSPKKDSPMLHATGPFDVTLAPQTAANADSGIARMTIDKQFHGQLEAASVGQMLSAMGTVKGSAGYVAIEKVTGTLNGRKGSFVLQHNATMDRGKPELNIIVVPDSGTGELEGLSGKMSIEIAPGGKHSYKFDYTLPEKP